MRELTTDVMPSGRTRAFPNALEYITDLAPPHPAHFAKDATGNTLELFDQTGVYRPRPPPHHMARASAISPTATQADVQLSTWRNGVLWTCCLGMNWRGRRLWRSREVRLKSQVRERRRAGRRALRDYHSRHLSRDSEAAPPRPFCPTTHHQGL